MLGGMQNDTEKKLPAQGETHAMLYGRRTNVIYHLGYIQYNKNAYKSACGIDGLSARDGN